jgi:hypothetical protein
VFNYHGEKLVLTLSTISFLFSAKLIIKLRGGDQDESFKLLAGLKEYKLKEVLAKYWRNRGKSINFTIEESIIRQCLSE